MIFKTKSSFILLFLSFKIEHFINPWVLIVNLQDETITVEKRNWYFIGKNRNIIAFRFIRNININENLFSSDIYIKAIGGSITAYCLPKKDTKKIRNMLIEYNQTKKTHIIFS